MNHVLVRLSFHVNLIMFSSDLEPLKPEAFVEEERWTEKQVFVQLSQVIHNVKTGMKMYYKKKLEDEVKKVFPVPVITHFVKYIEIK